MKIDGEFVYTSEKDISINIGNLIFSKLYTSDKIGNLIDKTKTISYSLSDCKRFFIVVTTYTDSENRLRLVEVSGAYDCPHNAMVNILLNSISKIENSVSRPSQVDLSDDYYLKISLHLLLMEYSREKVNSAKVKWKDAKRKLNSAYSEFKKARKDYKNFR